MSNYVIYLIYHQKKKKNFYVLYRQNLNQIQKGKKKKSVLSLNVTSRVNPWKVAYFNG